jgi:diguanylate cyclase (GGDEF)-like protein
VLGSAGQLTVFLLAGLAAVPAVVLGLLAVRPGKRRPWWLLLAALIAFNVADLMRTTPAGTQGWLSGTLDTAGDLLALAAVLAVVLRRGRNDAGGLTETIIIGLAVGWLLWDVVIAPLSAPAGSAVGVQTFVTVFALAGMCGALVRLAVSAHEPQPALWWLIGALVSSFVGNVAQSLPMTPAAQTTAATSFIATYGFVGLFGLDPSAPNLMRPIYPIADRLTRKRLVVLGAAIAVVPVAHVLRTSFGGPNDDLPLAVAGVLITTLVMVRIGQLSAQRDRAEAELRQQAGRDPLTNLANRREFVEQLDGVVTRRTPSAVLFCDLDGFKMVNDQWGHAAGDQLLTQVATRLRSAVRSRDLLSRFGGDEFVILLVDAANSDVEVVGERLTSVLSQPFRLDAATVTIGVSIGVATTVNHQTVRPEELIRRADRAMYMAKTRGCRRPVRPHRQVKLGAPMTAAGPDTPHGLLWCRVVSFTVAVTP